MNTAEDMSVLIQSDGIVRINEDLRTVDRFTRRFFLTDQEKTINFFKDHGKKIF